VEGDRMSALDLDRAARLAVARAVYADVPLYDPKRAPVDLDLTDNTNLWGGDHTLPLALRG
jgi:hypothetical protein